MMIDGSVYPDLTEPPVDLAEDADRADYVHRVCAAWDFGVHPDPETFELFAGWRTVFDRFPLPLSPGYRAFRSWFGWPAIEPQQGMLGPEPRHAVLDRLEGRSDPCEHLV
mgnify:CR=1 FL=1